MSSSGEQTEWSVPRLLTVNEAAEALRISVRELYRCINRQELPRPLKRGRRSYFEVEDIKAHIARLRSLRDGGED